MAKLSEHSLFASTLARNLDDARARDSRPTAPCSIPPLGPYRPARRPAFEPGQRRDRRDAGHRRHHISHQLATNPAVIRVAPDLGQIRINFSYRNSFGTSAFYSEKARRQMYCEGPHEKMDAMLFEIRPTISNFGFQLITLEWADDQGNGPSYTLDYGLEDVAGTVEVGEIKASQAYFNEPDTCDLLLAAEKALAAHGVTFKRRSAEDEWTDVKRRAVKEIYYDRRTLFDPVGDVDRVEDLVLNAGGYAPLGRVLEALEDRPHHALAKIRAMMCKGFLDIDLAGAATRDTLVTIPARPKQPGALRAFLSQFLTDEGA